MHSIEDRLVGVDIEVAATSGVGGGGKAQARVGGGGVLGCNGVVEVTAGAVLHNEVE